ncbi:hypothetical protein [Sulfurimonas sp.]|uniref:hypothetical protein n=1 Tax=Sulfurimonas sp. TaxID=2022749 RepID=UPI0025EE58A2|nr:hypothetical protein [Sulfurimonas sp.]MCK9454238.1 hypothetical protein [Sulfurimonas sp.]
MLIYHFTDLESALNIIYSKKFIAYSNNIYNGDSGLNSFPCLDGGFNYGQNFNKTGIILVFEWSGAVVKDASIYKPPHQMERNTMYIQGAWRSFIPVNTDSKYLKVVDIIYDTTILDKLIKYPFYFYLIPKFFNNLKFKIYEKYKLEADNQFKKLFEKKDMHISII